MAFEQNSQTRCDALLPVKRGVTAGGVAHSIRRGRRVACMCAFAISLQLAGCGPEPGTAPYKAGRGSVGFTRSFDETIVVNELYTYLSRTNGPVRYRYVGRPLRIALPRKYFAWTSNMEGGPQLDLLLSLDAGSLRPVVDVVRERYGARTPAEVYQAQYPTRSGNAWIPAKYNEEISLSISSRDAHRDILTEEIKISPDESEDSERYLYRASSKKSPRYIGEMCGFDVYEVYRYGSRVDDDKTLLLKNESYIGFQETDNKSIFAINKNIESPLKHMVCDAYIPRCNVRLRYRGFGTTATTNKKNICKYKSSMENIPKFLDRHMILPAPISNKTSIRKGL